MTSPFAIAPGLLGSRHTFTCDQTWVTIELPSPEDLERGRPDERRAKIFSWRREGGQDVPTGVAIYSVDILVQLPSALAVPVQILRQPANAYDVLTKAQQEQLESLAQTQPIVERAFDVWVRTLRWKAMNPFLCRQQALGPESGWGTRLLEVTTRHHFWIATQVIEVDYGRQITLQQWEETQHALHTEVTPPVYYDLLFDAHAHLRMKDYQRSVVDCAVACECYLRAEIMRRMPTSLTSNVTTYVDEANIRQVLTRFFPETLGAEARRAFDRISSSIHRLFNARNQILHSGRELSLTGNDCQTYLNAAEKLIVIT